MTARGRFITIDFDGAGKSSHLDHLCARARAAGTVRCSRGSPAAPTVGERLREVLHQSMTPTSEGWWMFGARSLHVTGARPALASGTWWSATASATRPMPTSAAGGD